MPTPENISIHTLRVEGDQESTYPRVLLRISIHTLRVEGDSHQDIVYPVMFYFYPHPPCGG